MCKNWLILDIILVDELNAKNDSLDDEKIEIEDDEYIIKNGLPNELDISLSWNYIWQYIYYQINNLLKIIIFTLKVIFLPLTKYKAEKL